ncbi:MAG: hypothetical protein WBB19_06520 [Desulforhopalus sp.]
MNTYVISVIAALIMFAVVMVSAGVNQASAPDSAFTPAGTAFGITLGKRFHPSMVARVIDRKPHNYTGPNGSQHEGTVLHIEPNIPDERFQDYSVKTKNDGIIYSIQAGYQFLVEPAQVKKMGRVKEARLVRSTCKAAVRDLALRLEANYGKPRGQGRDGEWFSFRQLSAHSDMSLNLYANRCRTGFYYVVLMNR